MLTNEVINYTTVEAMVATYQQEQQKILELSEELNKSVIRLSAHCRISVQLDWQMSRNTTWRFPADNMQTDVRYFTAYLRQAMWEAVVRKLGIRKLLSTAHIRQLETTLAETEGLLPELTVENINSFISGLQASLPEYMEAAVLEVYDRWRPRLTQGNRYVVNQDFSKLNAQIRQSHIVELYHNGKFVLKGDYAKQAVTSLDNVFHQLDGQPPSKDYYGELGSAIINCVDGKGATEYFSFTCYKNGNLFLKILREDLLSKFNQLAGNAHRLKGSK